MEIFGFKVIKVRTYKKELAESYRKGCAQHFPGFWKMAFILEDSGYSRNKAFRIAFLFWEKIVLKEGEG